MTTGVVAYKGSDMQAMESAILLQNFASLSEGFTQLGARLSQAASALQATGKPPAKTLIDELAASRISFAELCTRGVALAEALAFSPPPKPETISSLGDLKSLLQTLAQTEEKRNAAKEATRRALATLDRLYALKHREREVFAPLSECQMRATVLRNAIAETPWPNLHPSAEELGRDDNPFVVLLSLVEHGENLEDELCMKLHDIIERTFSRPLAVAALRGKLTFVTEAKPVRETQVNAAPVAIPTPITRETQASAAPAVPAVSERVGLNVSKRPSADAAQVNVTTSVPPSSIREKPSAPPPVMPSKVAERTVEPVVVSPQVRVVPEPSAEKPQGVVVERIAATEIPNAKLEMKVEPSPPVGAALLRPIAIVDEKNSTPLVMPAFVEEPVAAVTEPAVSVAKSHSDPLQTLPTPSELPAGTIEKKDTGIIDVFYRFELEDKAQKIASMVLTSAYGVVEEKPVFLRDLVWRLIFEEKLGLAFHVARCLEVQYPEFHPRLPSWLLRTVVLGQRVRGPQGDLARMLREDLVHCETDCRSIGDKDWDMAVEFLLLASAFLPALLAPETRASTILHGVCLGDGLENLAAYCNVIAMYGDLPMALDPTLFKKAVRPHAKESVGFMRRLIGSQENGGRKDIVTEQIEPLRIEILNRQQAVLDELQLLKQSTSSLPLLGSAAYCRRAIESVGLLLDPDAPFSTDEPLPRPLLNAELSRIPTLVLNKQGDVEGVEQPAFLENLLKLVASGSLKML